MIVGTWTHRYRETGPRLPSGQLHSPITPKVLLPSFLLRSEIITTWLMENISDIAGVVFVSDGYMDDNEV